MFCLQKPGMQQIIKHQCWFGWFAQKHVHRHAIHWDLYVPPTLTEWSTWTSCESHASLKELNYYWFSKSPIWIRVLKFYEMLGTRGLSSIIFLWEKTYTAFQAESIYKLKIVCGRCDLCEATKPAMSVLLHLESKTRKPFTFVQSEQLLTWPDP